jgi:hypothetical protein
MEEDECYAWELELFDEDGQLWIVTMFTLIIAPVYESVNINPILFPNLLKKISENNFNA